MNLADLWASVRIFFSNFNARWGWLIPLVLLALLALVVGAALLRAILAGRERRRSPSPYALRTPDEGLTDRAADALAQAVAIPTVTGDGEGIAALGAWIARHYAQLFTRLSLASMSDGSLVIRWRADGESERDPVLFCGHLDVVPPGSGWTEEPFSGERRDGAVCGRGAVDCKGTVIALLEAADALVREGFVPARDLYFAFGADEETGGTRGAAAIAELFARRGLHFSLVLDEGGYLAENHGDRPGHAAALVAVGEKRSCNYRLTASAPGGHSSTPPRRTATGALAEAVCRIESTQPHSRLLPVVSSYLRDALPALTFGKRFALCNLPFSRPLLTRVFRNTPRMLALLRSTLVPTQLEGSPAPNVLPLVAEGVVNARLLPGDGPEEQLARLRTLLADLPVRVELEGDTGPCPLSSPKDPMFVLLRDTLHEFYPRLPVLATLATGATDCRHYAGLADCVLRFTPLVRGARENAGVHGADERLPEQSLGLAVEFYIALLRRL